MSLSRRSLITGLISLVAAPAIVRASNLMPVRSYPLHGTLYICTQPGITGAEWVSIGEATLNPDCTVRAGIVPWPRQPDPPILGQIRMEVQEFSLQNLRGAFLGKD